MNIFSIADQWISADYGFAMITIISSSGSTPRHQAKMLVREDGKLYGTIGGGPGEHKAIDDALQALKEKTNTTKEYIFNKSIEGGLPTQCGGAFNVMIEVFPRKRRLILIGAGYVNQAVSEIAHGLDWRILFVDDRPNYATRELLPHADEIFTAETIEEAIEKVDFDETDVCVIATKDCDLEALRSVISSNFDYLGMIGSKRKVTKYFEQLIREGVDASRLERVFAPIGLDIGAETPFEIGISIVSEILKVLRKTSGNTLKNRSVKV